MSLPILKEISTDDVYSNYLAKLDPAKLEKVKNKISAYKTGVYASAPIMCYGPKKCPFLNKCPIPDYNEKGELIVGEEENYPRGMECIMERYLVESKTIEYVNYLNVDPDNPVEMSIVNELALIDLYKNRCLLVLSQGDKNGEGRDFLIRDIVAFNENGERAENTKLHPVIDMVEKLEKRRERWLDRLLETRESKAKMMAKLQGEKNNSRILDEITMLREALYAANSPKEIQKEILIDED